MFKALWAPLKVALSAFGEGLSHRDKILELIPKDESHKN